MYMSYIPCNMNYPYTLYYGCNSVSLSMLNLMNQANFCNALNRSIDANVQQCHNSVASQNLKVQMEAQTQQVLDFSKNIDNCPIDTEWLSDRYVVSASINKSIYEHKHIDSFENAIKTMCSYGISMEEAQKNICQAFGSTLYADNKPLFSEKPKKRYTIYDLDRFIFPEDPIRDWVEKRVAEINKKYSWIDQLDI